MRIAAVYVFERALNRACLFPFARLAATVCLGLLLSPSQKCSGQSAAEDQTILAMCRNGLSNSAIDYVKKQRDIAGDSEATAKWTMRLMECYSQAALRDVVAAEQWWSRCDEAFQQHVSQAPLSARTPWLIWQSARCKLLRSQSNLAAYLAAPGNSAPRDRALVLIREILQQMESLEDDLKRRLPLAARQSVSGGKEAPAEQLSKLLVDAGLMRCEALLIRARLYPAGSRDNVAAASDVESQAADILKRTGKDWASRTPLEIAQATAMLQLGQSNQALLQLTQIAGRSPPGRNRSRAAVTAIEFLAAQGQISRARGWLPFLDTPENANPDLALAEIQLGLAELNAANPNDREKLLHTLVNRSRVIGDQFGDYWRSRADALLTGSISSESTDSGSSATVELMIVEVRQLLAAGDENGAIRKLLGFRDDQASAGNAANAIQLASQAAALLDRQSKWLEAAQALQQTTLQFPNADQAPAAHLRAVYSISQALRSNPSDPLLSRQYEAALIEQLVTWPDFDTVEPRAWLRRWLVGKKRPQDYVATLAQQAIGSRDQTKAYHTLNLWLAEILNLPDLELRNKALETLQVAVSEGRLQVAQNSAAIVSLTAQVFSAWPEAPQAKQFLAESNRLSTMTRSTDNHRLLSAITTVHGIRNQAAPAKPLAWDADGFSTEIRRGLAPEIIDALGTVTPEQRTRWVQVLSLANWTSALGSSSDPRHQAAGMRLRLWIDSDTRPLAEMQKLCEQHPRNGPLQLQLAELLAEAGAKHLSNSTRIAKRLAANSPAGSQLNLAARWRILRNQSLAGEKANARTAAKLVLASHPIESELWKSRFERLAD